MENTHGMTAIDHFIGTNGIRFCLFLTGSDHRFEAIVVTMDLLKTSGNRIHSEDLAMANGVGKLSRRVLVNCRHDSLNNRPQV
jgi:hypothetical protein